MVGFVQRKEKGCVDGDPGAPKFRHVAHELDPGTVKIEVQRGDRIEVVQQAGGAASSIWRELGAGRSCGNRSCRDEGCNADGESSWKEWKMSSGGSVMKGLDSGHKLSLQNYRPVTPRTLDQVMFLTGMLLLSALLLVLLSVICVCLCMFIRY